MILEKMLLNKQKKYLKRQIQKKMEEIMMDCYKSRRLDHYLKKLLRL